MNVRAYWKEGRVEKSRRHCKRRYKFKESL